jgi:cytochrome c peroxidase/DNA-binding beta-propeller fold protein YncE
MRNGLLALGLALPSFACGAAPTPGARALTVRMQQAHSSSLAVSPDHARLFVVNPDADSVSALDLRTHRLLRETALSGAAPAIGADGRYALAVSPRALALSSTGDVVYVTGERSGALYAVSAASGELLAHAFVCSEPIGVAVSADDADVFVACSGDDEIVELSADDLSFVARTTCPRKPWSLAWASDGSLLATHLLGPGVSRFATEPLALEQTWSLVDGPARGTPPDPTEPHGTVRGIYDVVPRPRGTETWVVHTMLGIDTPQPELDFQRTAFPALSILAQDGRELARLSVLTHPADGGAFGDVVSGPRALTFSDDGKLAFVADADSEDVLVMDADERVELGIIRPLPGHLPEGVVWVDGELYVQERSSADVAAFRIDRAGTRVSIVADGRPTPTVLEDPMPPELRLGQRLFYSANSDDLPLTQNHWVACATCHFEGRSDAVTWLFAQGPRDTPSNAGGLLDTGFLFRTADRRRVEDYWQTIDVEQGGHFSSDEPTQRPLLTALAAFVNQAIPAPVPPTTDLSHAVRGKELADLRARGEAVFESAGCGSCHSGPAKTDSGAGNPELDLAGPVTATPTSGGVVLHDVGTCVTSGSSPDVSHQDIAGNPRDACAFDTPALRGLADSAPYLHDGSAATLADAVSVMLRARPTSAGAPQTLSSDDSSALVEFLRGL